MIKNPDCFLNYIKERIGINKRYGIKAFDELDYLGYYEQHGSLTKPKDLDNFGSPIIHGYSEKIDRWYSFKRGEVDTAKEPIIK